MVDIPDQPTADPSVRALFERYLKRGPHPEYKEFEARVAAGPNGRRRAVSVWDLINDAVTGKGGFSNGAYLFPFAAEIANEKLTEKYQRRQVEADYDRFAETVCNAPWDLIVSAKDMIERKATGEAEQLLAEFWANVDNHGMSMMDFLEYPFRQAREYTFSLVFVDREAVELATRADDRAPENRPYAYAVPTRNVVDWDFDDDNELVAIAVLEPTTEHAIGAPCPVRVWTMDAWALFTPREAEKSNSADAYDVSASGPNNLGMIPCVPIWNDQPDPGHLFGESEMPDVARLAQTVYNIDSEAREIERKCALFLAIPVKNTKDYEGGKIVIGTDSAMVYDGEAGEPRWVSPDLTVLDHLLKKREQKKDSAYEMAHLRALNGSAATIKTSSGFHAEVEFQKTERRIARHASQLERAEKQIAILYLLYFGIDALKTPDLFSITYPRDFGVRDLQKLKEDVADLLDMNLGDECNRVELARLFRARNPRLAEDKITSMVESAMNVRKAVATPQNHIDRIRAMKAQAQQAPAQSQMQGRTPSQLMTRRDSLDAAEPQ